MVHDRVAHELRLFKLRVRHPDRRQAEGRVGGRHAVETRLCVTRVYSEGMASKELAPRDLYALDEEEVLSGLKLQVVLYMDSRHHDAHLLGELPPYGLHPLKELSTLGGIDKRDEPVADLEAQGIYKRYLVHRLFLRGGPGSGLLLFELLGLSVLGGLVDDVAHRACHDREREEGYVRQSGYETEDEEYGGGDEQRLGRKQELLSDAVA